MGTLRELTQRDFGGLSRRWATAQKRRWSHFTSKHYEDVIASIRSSLGEGVPMWTIEAYWQGHQ